MTSIENRRRLNGEGTLEWLESRKEYRSRIKLNGHSKDFYAKSKGELREKVREAKRLAEHGVMINNKETVSQYLDRWVTTGDVRTKSIDSRIVCVNRMRPIIGSIKMQKLTAFHIDSMYKELAKELAPSSVRQVHAVLRKALNDAVKEATILFNPTQRLLDTPKVPKQEMNFLSKDEVKKLVAVENPMHKGYGNFNWTLLFSVAIHTGLRRGELLGLSWDSVDLEEGTLEVNKVLLSTRKGKAFGVPKTKKSYRTVPLNSIAVAALKKQRAIQSERKLQLGDKWEDTAMVFTNEMGKALDPSTPNKALQRSLAAAGIDKKIRFHDLRHTCASQMIEAGRTTKEVQDILGHSNYSTTMDIYVHTTEVKLKDAADSLVAHLA